MPREKNIPKDVTMTLHKVGLVLGSGSSRGWAHIGAIEALQDAKIPIHLNALRASMSYPGLFAPVPHKGRWLIDGGVVDPVPVGVARAMGSDTVIAVDLNSELISRKRHRKKKAVHEEKQLPFRNDFLKALADRYEIAEKIIKSHLEHPKKKAAAVPGTRQVINAAIQLMQERITRVNFAVNPPNILITPRLGDLKTLDYDQVEHAIEEGYIATRNKINDIRMRIETQGTEKTVTG